MFYFNISIKATESQWVSQESSCLGLLSCCISPLGMAWQCIISLRTLNQGVGYWTDSFSSSCSLFVHHKRVPPKIWCCLWHSATPGFSYWLSFSVPAAHVQTWTHALPCSFFLLHLEKGEVVFEPPPLDGRCSSCVACRKINNMQSHNFLPSFQVCEFCIWCSALTEMRQLLHLSLSSSVVLFLWVCPCCSTVSLKLTCSDLWSCQTLCSSLAAAFPGLPCASLCVMVPSYVATSLVAGRTVWQSHAGIIWVLMALQAQVMVTKDFSGNTKRCHRVPLHMLETLFLVFSF